MISQFELRSKKSQSNNKKSPKGLFFGFLYLSVIHNSKDKILRDKL